MNAPKIVLIRHGLTAGNVERRYIGRTDEPLCAEGVERLKRVAVPPCDTVYSSPMKRCTQTAEILFPGKAALIIDDFRECDFGDFEGKTAGELSETAAYRAWVDARCETPIPNGEDIAAFKDRVCSAFRDIELSGATALVIHGGCVMAILERFAEPKREFYDCRIGNGEFVAYYYEKGALLESRSA
jgi:alpha-ribazole phosphatase